MNKAELLALGLPEENMKKFQEFYHRDLRKAATRTDKAADELRDAIIPMLATIKDTGSLRAILATTTHHYLKNYLKNYREGKEEAPCPTGESVPAAEPI